MGAAGSTQATPVVVVTDGACSGNPGPGGWAAILRYETPEKVLHEKVLQGGASLTTNNRMELRAALAAFQALKRPSAVTVYTDSEYLRKGITEWLPRWVQNGWRTQSKEPVKNQDLWRALQNAMRPHSVSWQWVKGHAGNELNERADALAVNALNTIGVQAQPDMDGPPSGILV